MFLGRRVSRNSGFLSPIPVFFPAPLKIMGHDTRKDNDFRSMDSELYMQFYPFSKAFMKAFLSYGTSIFVRLFCHLGSGSGSSRTKINADPYPKHCI
jgi:hypothetical protein